MATTYAFVVILPNARRANVKASTNTTILEVLEDVCKKHELNPTEYDFTHHNKVLDLGNSIRFSGLPNNATLELITSKKLRTESPVNLGLQLESGKRLMHPFSPQQTLWEVLQYWTTLGEIPKDKTPPESGGGSSVVHPVVIYMRQEIMGAEALQGKTLRSLGLTQGSAIIRLVHRSESQLKTQANVSAPLSRPSTNIPVDVAAPRPLPTPNSPVKPHPQAQQAPKTEHHSPPPTQNHRQLPAPAATTATKHIPEPEPMDISEDGPPKLLKTEDSTDAESDVHVFSPPAIANAARFSKKGELHVIGAHDAILYHGDDVLIDSKDTDSASVDDSFFQLTVNEVKKQYMELQRKREEMENSPLTTKSTKELEKDTNTLRLLHDYPVTIVRIRFPDRYILQGCFRTGDKLKTVTTWLTTLLENPSLDFYLFTAPPKKILEKESSLVEQDLVGMTVIYFGSSKEKEESSLKVLKTQFYSQISAPDAVAEFVHKKLKKVVTPSEGQNAAAGQSSGVIVEPERARTPPPQRQPPPAPRTEGAVPKWFKTGK